MQQGYASWLASNPTTAINTTLHNHTLSLAGTSQYVAFGSGSQASCEDGGLLSIFDPSECQYAANILRHAGLTPSPVSCGDHGGVVSPPGCSYNLFAATWVLAWSACESRVTNCSATQQCVCRRVSDGSYTLVDQGASCADSNALTPLATTDECRSAAALLGLGTCTRADYTPTQSIQCLGVYVSNSDNCSIYNRPPKCGFFGGYKNAFFDTSSRNAADLTSRCRGRDRDYPRTTRCGEYSGTPYAARCVCKLPGGGVPSAPPLLPQPPSSPSLPPSQPPGSCGNCLDPLVWRDYIGSNYYFGSSPRILKSRTIDTFCDSRILPRRHSK